MDGPARRDAMERNIFQIKELEGEGNARSQGAMQPVRGEKRNS
jgi:hypothetical protein